MGSRAQSWIVRGSWAERRSVRSRAEHRTMRTRRGLDVLRAEDAIVHRSWTEGQPMLRGGAQLRIVGRRVARPRIVGRPGTENPIGVRAERQAVAGPREGRVTGAQRQPVAGAEIAIVTRAERPHVPRAEELVVAWAQ